MDKLKLYIDEVGGPTEFARRMGVSPVLVYKILRGERAVSKNFALNAEQLSGGFLKKDELLWPPAA